MKASEYTLSKMMLNSFNGVGICSIDVDISTTSLQFQKIISARRNHLLPHEVFQAVRPGYRVEPKSSGSSDWRSILRFSV
jgi:hypothetical protein